MRINKRGYPPVVKPSQRTDPSGRKSFRFKNLKGPLHFKGLTSLVMIVLDQHVDVQTKSFVINGLWGVWGGSKSAFDLDRIARYRVDSAALSLARAGRADYSKISIPNNVVMLQHLRDAIITRCDPRAPLRSQNVSKLTQCVEITR